MTGQQFRARVTGKVQQGGGQLGQASLYRLALSNGTELVCDYVEIASDGFRTLDTGDEVWCAASTEREGWAVYVVPIRDCSPLGLLGLALPDDIEEAQPDDPISYLWL